MKTCKPFFILSLIAAFGLSGPLFSQGRHATEIFQADANYRNSGWFVGLGTNKMFADDRKDESVMINTSDSPLEYNLNVDANGKFGLYVELGGFKLIDNGFFDFLDYGLAYRQEAGMETLVAIPQFSAPNPGPGLLDSLNGQGEYSQDHVRGFFNLNKSFPIARHTCILTGIGVDLEYRVINKAEYFHDFSELDSLPVNPFSAIAPSEYLSAHLHFKAGVGYKTGPGSWLTLTAESPIQNIFPFDGVQSRQTIFNAAYRPVIFSLRYMWLRKRPDRSCEPVKSKKVKKNAKRKGKSKRGIQNGQIH